MYQNGKPYQFFYDSGAECSLIFKRFYHIEVLTGIGENIVKCNLQILSKIQISLFILEVLLHVVEDNH